jgi:hypothetical protein
MALDPNSSSAYGMYKAVKDSESVFGPTNKTNTVGGFPHSENREEYTSSMSDSEVTKFVDTLKRRYERYYKDIEISQKKAFDYWIGKQTLGDLTVTGTTSDLSYQSEPGSCCFDES